MISCIDKETMKTCSSCKVNLDLSCFSKNRSRNDGLDSRCKACKAKWYQENSEKAKASTAKWQKVNAEKKKVYDARYYLENIEKKRYSNAKYYQENSKKCKASKAKYHQENPEKQPALNAKRRSTKRQATPPWYSKDDHLELIELYAIAKHRSEVTGKPYHVDHIHALSPPKVLMFEGELIPLVCGLHIPANWAVLEGSKNISKSNKFESYVWSECSFNNPWEV